MILTARRRITPWIERLDSLSHSTMNNTNYFCVARHEETSDIAQDFKWIIFSVGFVKMEHKNSFYQKPHFLHYIRLRKWLPRKHFSVEIFARQLYSNVYPMLMNNIKTFYSFLGKLKTWNWVPNAFNICCNLTTN